MSSLQRLYLVVTLGLGLPAWAQTGAVSGSDPSRGAALAPTSVATIDDASAIGQNPAGLTFVDELQLFYAHEQNVAQGRIVDGLYLADTLFEAFGVGFGIDWVRGGAGPAYRKTTYAASLGSPGLSIGASYNHFSSGDPDLNGLGSFALGLAGRPIRSLAFGATVRNLDAPARGAISLARRYELGLAVRPMGERLTLSADLWLDDTTGFGGGRMNYAVRAEVVKGVSLLAGVSHGFRSADEFLFQVGATVDTSHLGLTYAFGSAPAGADHVVGVRLSRQNYRALELFDGSIAVLDLAAALESKQDPLAALLGQVPEDPYLRLTRFLDAAARDVKLKGLVLRVREVDVRLGKAEELRAAIQRLRAANKVVVALVLSAGDTEYLAISSADRIVAAPESHLFINGFSASPVFLGATMTKLGVHWDVARVGSYKNAPDQFTRESISKEQRESIDAYLDTDVQLFEQTVTRARNISTDRLKEALSEGLLTPRRAKELGLIDDVLSPFELEEKLPSLVPGGRLNPRYRPRDVRTTRWGDAPQIAIVPVLGSITQGKSDSGTLGMGETAGADSVVRALRRAADDSSVSAIVVRVDSGGGDGLASDLIYRAVLEARKKKPVVASMGDVAASGGYYVAMGADEIYAEPTTITGSIGVFFLKPAVRELAEKLGAHQDTIKRGELSTMTNLFEPWSDAERAAAQKWVEAFYDDFITEVGTSRRLPKEKVDEIARGRVWSGADAKARGLVDHMGGLLEAIEAARRRAGIDAREEAELVVVSERRGLFSGSGDEGLLEAAASTSLLKPPLPDPMVRLARELGLEHALMLRPGLWAAMEYDLRVR